MEAENVSVFQFPPGFKFHPSDEELITHYLLNKLKSHPLPADVIAEIELYNFSPWELPKKALFGKDEWFFFTPRDRKYPNGERPNRTAASGYWKATGIDKPILTDGSRKIGVKKALVFYTGRSPKGVKTNWIMSEYRVPETSRSSKLKGSMRLDDWVLCRVQQKGNMSKKIWEDRGSHVQELMNYFTRIEELPSTQVYSHTNIITELRNRGCQALSTVLSGHHLPQVENTSSEILQDRNRENEGSLYEYGANNADSVCDIIRNMSRGKFSEEYKGLPQSNTLNTNNLNFYIHRQYAPDIFSSNPFDIISSLQGLDESAKVSTTVQQAFTEKQQF